LLEAPLHLAFTRPFESVSATRRLGESLVSRFMIAKD
jgi:hypothetical protein